MVHTDSEGVVERQRNLGIGDICPVEMDRLGADECPGRIRKIVKSEDSLLAVLLIDEDR